MLDKLTYISSTGNEIRFGDVDSHILINTNDFRDYAWSYSRVFKRLSNFNRNTVEKTLPILIYGSNTKEIANSIFEIIDNDVLLNQYGRLYSGDYYVQGYFVASSKVNYTADGFLSLNLTFATDRPYWIRETNYQYRPSEMSREGLSYPYDYPYDYLPNVSTQDIINPSFTEQNIKIIIYGECSDPAVMVDDYVYQLDDIDIDEDEYVTINTADKTIVLTHGDGTTENVFNSRSRDSYIFQKVPSGKHAVSVLPITNLDITILEERSEPIWQ